MSVAAALVATVYATGVFFMGWHRPSDAVGGILWSGFCLGLAASLLALVKRVERPFVFRGAAAPLLVGLCGLLAALVVWVAGGFLGDARPDLDFPYLAMTALIVASAFAVPGWFGFTLDGAGEI